MTRDEAIALVKAGAYIVYSRASMGSKASARVVVAEDKRYIVRPSTAMAVVRELAMRPDKPVGITKIYQPEK